MKTSLKSLFAFFHSLSWLFQLVYFVQMLANSPEVEAVQWPPTARKCLKKRAMHGQIQGLLVFYQSYSHLHLVIWYPLWNIFFPVNYILRISLYFSLGCRAWHRNLGLIIEKWAFRNFQGRSKKDKMRISCDSVPNVYWRSKHVKYN